MAWLLYQKADARYSPTIELTPSSREIHSIRGKYGNDHPELFFEQRNLTSQGVAMPETCFPVSGKVVSSHKSLPDVVNLQGYGFSGRLKALVEELEPGVHQFSAEIPLMMKNGDRSNMPFYAVIVGHVARDQVVLSASSMPRSSGLGTALVTPPRKGDDDKIAISRAATNGWHMWHSHDLFNSITVSDELRNAMLDLGVKCFDYIRLNEVDSGSLPGN